MRTLGIETSGPRCGIALFDGDACIAERHDQVGRGHAEWLIPWIAEFPDGGRADRILVGCGPGSFTGVRVGIAAARGLGLGWGVPVHGVSSIALIAWGFGSAALTVAIAGGHGEIFVQDFAAGSASGTMLSLTPEAAASRHRNAIVVGSGAASLVAARGFGEAQAAEPDARHMLALFAAGQALPPVPVYGRGADAKPVLSAAAGGPEGPMAA